MTLQDAESTIDAIRVCFAPLEGRRLLDIGCGRGALLRALWRRGAQAAGVDPHHAAVLAARESAPEAQALVAGAEALPFPDEAFAGAIFLNSLHHVPVPRMADALREALRVTQPGECVLVVEPLAKGAYHEVLVPVEDETEIRSAALAAVEALIADGEAHERERGYYVSEHTVTGAEEVLRLAVEVDPGRAEAVALNRDHVRKLFDLLARPAEEGDGFVLEQPMVAIALTRR